MRKKKFAFFCSVVMAVMSACTQGKDDTEPTEMPMGEVFISLEAEGLPPQSKASVEVGIPDVDDLTVEIFKKTEFENVRLHRYYYDQIKGKAIKLNCADYRILAFYGDSLAVGKDVPYFEGCEDFSLTPEKRQENKEITVKVANVRVGVEYGENLEYDYPEFYVKVNSRTPGGKKKSVEFYHDESGRKAFLPYGVLTVELYAKVDGQWKYFPSREFEAVKGDDFTFKINTKRLEGKGGITVTVAQLDKKEEIYEISGDMLPQDAPSVNMSDSFAPIHELKEGDAPKGDLRMNIVADGNIKECWLNVTSEYLKAKGVPDRVNLASDEISPRAEQALKEVGLKWMKDMSGRRFAYVDFSGITEFICENQCNPDNLFSADFSLEIVDERNNPDATSHVGTIKTKTYSFVQGVPAPKVSVQGFENGPVEILEGTGVTYTGLKASVEAKGRIGHCYLHVSSPYMGLPSKIDLCDVDADTAQKLRGFGITWPDDIADRTNAEIDFSGLSAYMDKSMYNAAKGADFASFSIVVKNEKTHNESFNETSASAGNFRYVLPDATLTTIQNYNVWAKKIYDFSVNLTKGNPQQVKFQYSAAGGPWTDITENTNLSGTVLSCSKLATASNTLYNIRAIYHNNPDLSLTFNPVTTEAEAQIPNSDFESWLTKTFAYTKKTVDTGTGYRDWYIPGTSETDLWWAVNSKRTMPDETNGNFGGDTQPYKVFPTISYSVNNHNSGSKSAQIMTIGIGKTSTGISLEGGDKRVVAGELFIGKADDDGNHLSDGHAFSSRPSKMTFKYQYKSIEGETFCAVVAMTLGDRIVTKEYIGGHSDSWATATIDLTAGADYDKAGTPKATSIYMSFKSTNSSSPAHELKESEEVAGQSYNLHRGSVLRIDDLQLIYE